MHNQELQRVIDTLGDIEGRFQNPPIAAAPHLSSADRAAFKRLMLEAKSMLDIDLGPLNDFSLQLSKMHSLPSYGMLKPPSPEELKEAIEIIEGGLNQLRRKQNRPSSQIGSPQRPHYVAPTRISELQALKDPKFDPRRLIRMLQELNLAHENDMYIASAMLVRGIIDHVPPIFGQANFADVAAQHSAGSSSGRSFKGPCRISKVR